jgi:hypothetical protein
MWLVVLLSFVEDFLVSSRAFCALPTVGTPLWLQRIVLAIAFGMVEDCVALLMFCSNRSSWLHDAVESFAGARRSPVFYLKHTHKDTVNLNRSFRQA